MKKPEDAYHHGSLRTSLVEEAVRVIAREGLDAFSLREVARRVGVSANAAYRHFEDKDALLAAVAAHAFDRLAREMRQAIGAVTTRGAGPRAIAHLRATGRAYVTFALAEPELFRLAFGSKAAKLDVAHRRDGAEPDPYQVLSRCLDAMVEAGVLPEARRPGAELKAWAVVHGYAALALGDPTLASLAPLEGVLDFVIDGLTGSPQRARPGRRR
ncbi:MAG: TetR/AcrR family transcriptional regulator [Sandaracinaceae bacterium]